MLKRPRARLIAYGVAVLGPALSLLLRWPLWPVLADHVPHMTFLPAVALAAYFGGFRPGLLATLLGGLAADFFLWRWGISRETPYVHVAVGFTLFVTTGAVLSALSESLHRARLRIQGDERRRAELVLRESEERFRQLAENVQEIYWVMDAIQNRLTYVSPAFEEVSGRPRQRLYEQPCPFWECTHPDDREALAAHQDKVRQGVPASWEFRMVRPDGEIRWLRNRTFPVFDERGGVARVVGLAEDVTEQKRADEALRDSEQRFRTFVDHATDAFFLQDDRGVILDVNRRACESLGMERDELVGRTPFAFDPDFTHALREELDRQLEAGEAVTFESRHRRKDGSTFPVEVRGRAFWQAGRRFLVSTARDVTLQKQAELELRESGGRWRCLAEALPQLVWSALPDGACDYFGAQWTQHTGVAEADLLGWEWLRTLHPDDREPTRRSWMESLAGVTPYDVEYRVRRHDGEYRWFKTRGVPLRDGAGAIAKWFGTCTDVTDSKRHEQELRRAMEAAESANRAKDEFLANVSHEIRTPMNAILGMTELVLETPLTDGQRQCLTTVKSAADSLLRMINDLLDFARIESGKMELDPTAFSLRAALGDVLRALAVPAHEKGLELVSSVQPDVPDALVGDAGRLRQVLLNLVGNAVKFTRSGEVVITVSPLTPPRPPLPRGERGEQEERSASPLPWVGEGPGVRGETILRFEVRDTGIGVPKDKQESIFRAFEQEDTSTTRKYGGTGLGLTIASRLVALMGGEISVDSEPGQGSTFSFTARFGRPSGEAPPAAAPPSLLPGVRVLVVDDNSTNRRILTEWLRGWGAEAASVGDGMAALDALWYGVASGRPYALALLDGRMPDTDGLALAARIRERAELSSARLILLTSGDRPGDLSRSRALGVDAHVLKPVQQDELLARIERALWKEEGGRTKDEQEKAPAPGSSLPGPSSLRILVAEDNEFNAQLMEQLLSRRGHAVRLAGDGREALALAEASRFDLLLLDVHMPELDGFGVIRAIRQREQALAQAEGENERLPVIALTARSRREDRERCLAAGMDDYLAKPVVAADLWAAIDRVVHRKEEGGRMKGEQEKAPAPGSSCLLDTSFPRGLIDARALLAACGGDPVILAKISEAFRTRLPGQLEAVLAAMRDGHAARLREAAHKISGILSAFSGAAGAVASDLEDRAAAGRLGECGPLVGRLERMAQELIEQACGLSIDDLRRQAEG